MRRAFFMLLASIACGYSQTNIGVSVQLYSALTITGEVGNQCVVQCAENAPTNWHTLVNFILPESPYFWVDRSAPASPQKFYQVLSTRLTNMALVPAGSFVMGDTFGDDLLAKETPLHSVSISGFLMDRRLVSKALWDDVKVWGLTNGYTFTNAGSGKGLTHPVYGVNWFDAVKWCNARSQKESLSPCYYTDESFLATLKEGEPFQVYVKWNANGYRLPTEAEWEKAARGGVSGKRFPWGDVITHNNANYNSRTNQHYDISQTRGFHPSYDASPNNYPYSNPVDAFPQNEYGLHDMAGNLRQWCWDRFRGDWYQDVEASQDNTRGPSYGDSSANRAMRGGSFGHDAYGLRSSCRDWSLPGVPAPGLGFTPEMKPYSFRCVRGLY